MAYEAAANVRTAYSASTNDHIDNNDKTKHEFEAGGVAYSYKCLEVLRPTRSPQFSLQCIKEFIITTNINPSQTSHP
jgi:hypothetical protein